MKKIILQLCVLGVLGGQIQARPCRSRRRQRRRQALVEGVVNWLIHGEGGGQIKKFYPQIYRFPQIGVYAPEPLSVPALQLLGYEK